ncbi:hypothetical protein F4777DRAFT_575994 [Nemania sp. FL0916]|nr:hypothetical protein F4777DRAFT_575994 [Nemania sp. FL0916]
MANPPKNSFVAYTRKVYNPLGFSKGYNFALWFVFCGALFAFSLARLPYLNFWGIFCNPNRKGPNAAMPGECFYFTQPGRYHVGIIIHLATVLPGSLLAVVQFVPVIRRKFILLHRINGYVVVVLGLLGAASALVIAPQSAGGGLDVHTLVGLLSILFVGSLIMGFINIKRLQLEEHRAWMIRAWALAASIITTRLILFIIAIIITYMSNYYLAQPCDKINFTLKGKDATLALYPECAPFFSGENPDQHAVVKAKYGGNIMEIGTALNLSFGPAAWLALFIHAFAAELYLRLTPAESDRLRNISYKRQLDAGMKNPGSAGLTIDRFGDANKWTPDLVADKKVKDSSEPTEAPILCHNGL